MHRTEVVHMQAFGANQRTCMLFRQQQLSHAVQLCLHWFPSEHEAG